MTKTVADKPSGSERAAREPPDQPAEAPVDGFADRLDDAALSAAQCGEIDRRLANPRYADPNKVREFFEHFGLANG